MYLISFVKSSLRKNTTKKSVQKLCNKICLCKKDDFFKKIKQLGNMKKKIKDSIV